MLGLLEQKPRHGYELGAAFEMGIDVEQSDLDRAIDRIDKAGVTRILLCSGVSAKPKTPPQAYTSWSAARSLEGDGRLIRLR